MNKKMIITDMDGTIMPSPDFLPERNAEVLRRACAEGVLVVLASARPYGMLEHIHRSVCPDMPFVCLNGARIYSADGKVLSEHDIDEATVSAIFDGLKDKDKLSNIVIEYGNELYTMIPPKNPYMKEEERCVGRINIDPQQLPNIPASRLMLYTTDKEYNEYLCSLCKSLAEPRYTVRLRVFGKNAKKQTYRYEISDPRANKWAAAAFLADMYGIDRENIWAFGDEWNDIDMINNAAHGYAVKGSSIEGCGKGTTESVADTIEKEVLG